MPKFTYLVTVDTDTKDHADQVMSERCDYDEEVECIREGCRSHPDGDLRIRYGIGAEMAMTMGRSFSDRVPFDQDAEDQS